MLKFLSENKSFKTQHKAQVKAFVQKVQNTHMEQFQQYRVSKAKIDDDFKLLKVDTLKLFQTELSTIIADIENPKSDEEQT